MGLLGLVIVCLVAYEALRRTLVVSSETGPVTGRLMRSLGVALALPFPQDPSTISTTPGDAALVRAADMQAASAWERFFYVATSLFSVGAGEFVPHGVTGHVLKMANAASGDVLLTLGLSYLIPVVQSGAQKCQGAACISEMCKPTGRHPAASLEQKRISSARTGTASLRAKIPTLAQQHLACPVPHYYHSTDRDAALAPMVAVFG